MKNQIKVVVIAVIKKGDTFLLTKRIHLDPEDKEYYHNAWQLPGGGLEFAEDPVSALYREVREEVGLEITVKRLIAHVFTEVRGNWQGVFLPYLCEMNDESDTVSLNDEASEYSWFTIDQIKKLKHLPLTLEILNNV